MNCVKINPKRASFFSESGGPSHRLVKVHKYVRNGVRFSFMRLRYGGTCSILTCSAWVTTSGGTKSCARQESRSFRLEALNDRSEDQSPLGNSFTP